MTPCCITPVQLRWDDIDQLGHLYNGKYHSLYDIGQHEFILDIMGVKLPHLRTEEERAQNPVEANVYPLKVNSQVNFLKEVHMGHNLRVETSLEKIGNKSITTMQRLLDENNNVMSDCRTVMACVDLVKKESVAVPKSWIAQLEKYL